MKYKHTQCAGCGTKDESLYARGKLRNENDYWCKPCMDEGKHLH